MPTPTPSSQNLLYDHVVVVGVGLIGGSIAKALKARGLAKTITGLGRNRDRLLAAREAGLLDEVATSVSELEPFTLAVVCTPVDRIVEDIRALQSIAQPHALLTDAGSVKGGICRQFSSPTAGQAVFLGSHPLAGSEQGGWEHADANLFAGRMCAVTPLGHPESVIRSIEAFWSALGMRLMRLDPDQHDQIVALTSHLPHVAASAIASLLRVDAWPLAATGFRDTTRVASGDPGLWASILLENRAAVQDHLADLIQTLHQLTLSLDAGDKTQIEAWLSQGKTAREAWLKSQSDR